MFDSSSKTSRSRAWRLIWPEGLATIVGIALVTTPSIRWSAAPFLAVYPWVVLGVGLLLGARFARLRLVSGLVVLALAATTLWLVAPDGIPTTPAAAGVTSAIALLVPIDLLLVSVLPEDAARRWSRAFGALLGISAAAIFAAKAWRPVRVADILALPLFPVDALDLLRVSQLPTLAFLVAAMILAFRAMGRDPTARGMFWATLAAYAALALSPGDRTLHFANAGLAIVVAMVESSYALAFHDDLTGLPGRRAFNRAIAGLQGRFVVAIVDVDHFKQFNDRHGHDVGDQVLKLVANRLAAIGGNGRPFRHGGEEFAVVFPDATLEEATSHLEAVRQNIEATTFTLRAKDRPGKPDPSRRGRAPRRRDISVTVSIGVAQSRGDRAAVSVIKAADQALYRAKDQGRNRVEAA